MKVRLDRFSGLGKLAALMDSEPGWLAGQGFNSQVPRPTPAARPVGFSSCLRFFALTMFGQAGEDRIPA